IITLLHYTGPLQQEEVRVILKQLQRKGAPGDPAHRIVLAAHAQNWDGHLVHVPQRVVPLPVGVPAAGPGALRAEENLLHSPQGAAGEESVGGHGLCKRGFVPESE
uniref:Uncharacterized protein n=1 Tax=Denticeps clupeoides TaxID=299321 RepID=A0AAY4D587_9TELE